MTGRHYAWHRAWTVDVDQRTATHETGLTVHFAPAADDARAWSGAADPIRRDAVLAELAARHGAHNAPQRLARLMREAQETWTHAIERKTRRGADR